MHKHDPKKTCDTLRTLLPAKPKAQTPTSISVNSMSLSDPILIAKAFNEHFAKIGKTLINKFNVDHDNAYLSYLKHSCPSSLYLYPTTPAEIFRLITLLKINKANGHNDIPPYFLRIAVNTLALPLSSILNQFLLLGIFPDKLTNAKVVPVYKNGSSDQLGNYRPISLLMSLSKIFERIIFNRMTSFLKRNNTSTQFAFGFRLNHSAIHPILDLITSCLDNIHNKQCSALVFLDIKKAFDSVCHEKLIKKLDHNGIRGIANCMLSPYLDNRKQYVSFNNINSSTENIECGVPQKSILGPLLFLIYINDLPNCLKTDPRYFADDTSLLIDGKNFADVESATNSTLSHISRWMIANSLTVNPKKILRY